MGNAFFMDWEVSLMAWLQQTLSGFGMKVAQLFSTIGGETITLMVCVAVIFCWSKESGKRTALTVLVASAWVPMVKNIALRLRPYMVHKEIQITQLPEADAAPMDVLQQGYSFPSGHSAMAAGLYGGIAREAKKRWTLILAVVMTLMIGVSRFVVGAHYPTDVLTGWTLGLLAVGFGGLLVKKVSNENIRNLIVLATVLPGIFWCQSRDYFSALGGIIGLILAVPYEKKYVNFQDTRRVPVMILRVLGAAVIYFGLNTLLKMPFSTEFLNSGTLGANLIRSLRYMILMFLIIGVYPHCFPAIDKLCGANRQNGKETGNGSR